MDWSRFCSVKLEKKKEEGGKKIVCLAVLGYITFLPLYSPAKLRSYCTAEIIPYQVGSALEKLKLLFSEYIFIMYHCIIEGVS